MKIAQIFEGELSSYMFICPKCFAATSLQSLRQYLQFRRKQYKKEELTKSPTKGNYFRVETPLK